MISGEIVKMYIAVLTSAPKEAEGTIDIPLRRCDDSIIKRRTCTIDDLGAKSALYRPTSARRAQSGRCAVLASPVTAERTSSECTLPLSAVRCAATVFTAVRAASRADRRCTPRTFRFPILSQKKGYTFSPRLPRI